MDVSHVAATPAGIVVAADVRLLSVEGRKLRFAVSCRDECEPVGEGHHERAIIRAANFVERVNGKRGG